MKFNDEFMQLALNEAKKASLKGEVPVGAAIVNRKTGKLEFLCHNETISENDPLAHAEIIAIREVTKKIKSNYLLDFDLYSTLEPCPMCAYAISLAKIGRVYFGAFDKKSGGVENGPMIFNSSSAHHKPEIYGGIMERESKEVLQNFFLKLRSKDSEI